ncbi:MAG TPA: hypothetical protein VHM28_01495, partial [Anaerolineales bacterium]|nr:hypothetical protein [Anaerolineales bacterium]
RYHLSYSEEIDFSAAAYFTTFFGRLLLEKQLPKDVDLLKVDVPSDATPQTAWQVTSVAHQRYYDSIKPNRKSWDVRGRIAYKEAAVLDDGDETSDVFVLRKKRLVSVTPLSLDMTSRIGLSDLEKRLKE